MPVAELRELHTARAYYALRPLDSRARITDRALARRMGWRPGQRLLWWFEGEVIVMTPQEHGPACVTSAGHLSLSARCCQAASTRAGDRVLFVARTGAPYLIMVPPRVFDEMMTDRLAGVMDGGAL
jgi:hypothetical protein